MARPRGDSDNPVSLFPFLSILACVIGVLILLIASLTISQLESDPEEELVSRVEEYETIEKEQQELDDTLKEMLPKVHELEEYREAIRKLEAQAEELRKKKQDQLAKSKEQSKELDQLLQLEKNLLDQIAKLKQEREKLLAETEKLKAELERRRMVIDAPTVTVLPGKGKGRGKGLSDTVFVEADAKGIILDPGGKRQLIPTSKLSEDPRFKQAVSKVAGNPEKALVILIREDGINAYRTAENLARTGNAIVAKLPIVGKGKLDLSKF